MIQQLLGRGSLIDVSVQGAFHEVDGSRVQLRQIRLLPVNFLFYNRLLHLLLVDARERIAARQQHVRDDADGPDVYLLIVVLSTNKLRRHVERTSEHRVEATVGVEKACESKVRDLDLQVVFIF